MSDLKRYYDEEMRYLLGAGREYARAHPDAAHALSIAEVEDRDPYVERVFENFAFLAARVRQTLDTQDESMAGQLLDQAAPGLECPLPAVAMIEFTPRPDTSETGRIVNRGSEVRTAHISGLQRPARFRTTRDCPIHPLRLEDVRIGVGRDGQSCLEFSLVALDSVGMARWPDELEIHFGGEASVAWTLRHWLIRKARRIEYEANGSLSATGLSLSATMETTGYSLETSPASQPLLDLRDFFCTDDRFRFATLRGLGDALTAGTKFVRIRIQFDQPLTKSLEQGVDPKALRLNTVPVANAFSEASQPHLLDPSRTDYPLLAANGEELEVLETDVFQGASQSDPTKSHVYQRFSAWRHSSRRSPENGWYQVHRRPNRSGGMKTSISVGHPDLEFAFGDEYLGGHLWCCDGDKPCEAVRPSDISEPSTGIPSGLSVLGLTRPSQVYRPPATPDFRWMLLSHFQRSFRDLARVKNLKETLRLLQWDPRELKKACIEKISDLELSTGYELVDALPKPITRVHLTFSDDTIQPDGWDKIGQLDVLASIIHRLLAARTPVGTRLVLSFSIQSIGLRLEHGA